MEIGAIATKIEERRSVSFFVVTEKDKRTEGQPIKSNQTGAEGREQPLYSMFLIVLYCCLPPLFTSALC